MNNTLDNNSMKSFGVARELHRQQGHVVLPELHGWSGADRLHRRRSHRDAAGVTEEDKDANGRWRHLIDVIADMHFDKAHVLVNADYGTEKMDVAGTRTPGLAPMPRSATR